MTRAGATTAELADQAEIHHFHLFLRREEEIGRLDVAVDQMLIVCLLQAAGRLPDPLTRLGNIHESLVAYILLEISPRN
jgi:hypothetical protein